MLLIISESNNFYPPDVFRGNRSSLIRFILEGEFGSDLLLPSKQEIFKRIGEDITFEYIISQNGQTLFKNLAAFAARFLKSVLLFWNIMHLGLRLTCFMIRLICSKLTKTP